MGEGMWTGDINVKKTEKKIMIIKCGGGYDDTLRKWLGNDGEEYTEYRRPTQKIGRGGVELDGQETNEREKMRVLNETYVERYARRETN